MAVSLPAGGDDDGEDSVLSMINTTPLVDVMLVLLIIFLITIPVVTASVPVALPKETAAPAPQDKDMVIVAATRDGHLFWNDQPLEGMEDLARHLAQAAAQDPKPLVQVRGDGDARIETVSGLIAAARDAGLTRLGFATEPQPVP